MPLEFPQHSLDSFPARGLGCSDSISDLSKFEPHRESKKAILAIQREEFLNGTALITRTRRPMLCYKPPP